jgi:hypothetical protein
MDGRKPLTNRQNASARATDDRRARLAERRKLAPPVPTTRSTPFLRGLKWLLPWTQYHYPGFRKGVCLILHVSEGSLKHWIGDRRAIPETVRQRLIEAIRGRLDAGHTVLAELEAYRPPVRENPIRNIQRARALRNEAAKP